MRLSQEAIQRMISGRSGGGVGGGGSFDPSALAGYATQAWTEENYISKTFFNELFVIHKRVTTVVMDGETEISRTVTTNTVFAPNEIPGTTTETDEETGYVTTVTTEISSIESKKGFWTNYFLSALGLNGEGGGGGLTLNEPLATINDAGLAAHPSSSGQTIVWNGSAWTYGTAGGSGMTYTFATGDANGQFKVTPSSGAAYNVSIKGLAALAYKASLAVSDIPDLSGTYLPLSAGSSKPLTGSLYLSSLGKGIFAPYTVSGSTVNIPLIYDNGTNLWIGSTETTGTHHVGATYISAGTGEAYISRLVSGTRTNYKVLDKGNTYVSGGKGYIDSSEITTISGNAGTASRLQGNGVYMAWGQTYWQNGVPQTVNGDMTNVGNISFSASGKNIGGLMSFITAGNGTVGVGTLSPNTNYKLDVNGYTKTSRLYLSDTIYMVVQNDGIHIVGGGLYADTYVSALGLNDSGGGSVSSLSELSDVQLSSPSNGQALIYDSTLGKWKNGAAGMNMSELTTYLSSKILTVKNGTATIGTWNPTAAGTIDIASALTDVVKYKDVGEGSVDAMSGSFFFGGNNAIQSGYDYVGFQAGYSLDKWQMTAIGSLRWRQNDNGGTDSSNWSDWRTILDTSNWTSTINLSSLGAASTSELNNYLPLSAGSTKPLTGSLYMSSLSKGIFVPYTVNGSTVNIPLIYDNGENLWIGSTATASTHHIGRTYISAGYDGSAGNSTIYVSVPNASNNNGTNYGVLHSGNYTDWVYSKGQVDTMLTNLIANGTVNRLAYYTGQHSLGHTGNILLMPNTLNSKNAYMNGLRIWGTCYGNSASSLISGTEGLLSYGDGGPQIIFAYGSTDDSQSGTLLYTDNDSCGAGASFHFLSNQSDWNVHSKRFVARSSVTIGQNTPNTSYALYTSGNAYFTSRIYLASGVYLEYNGNGGVHLVGAGFYSDSYVSALGLGDGGGGITLNEPLASINNAGLAVHPSTSGQTIVWNGSAWVYGTAGGGSGSVTSVGMTVPTGFVVSGSPVTSSGTLGISFASGYSLPTTAKQLNWDTAYGWGNHANAGYLTPTTGDARYLKLSGGTMTGLLSIATGIGLQDATGNGLLCYHPTSYSGVTSSQWGAGAVDCQGVIRSNASNLLHYRGGTSYNILDSYNSGISGSTITINGTSINSVAHIEVGTNDLTGYSGSFFFGGDNALQSGYDYVGFQAGNSADKWQMVAIDTLKWRQNESGGTSTSWGQWYNITDNLYIQKELSSAGWYRVADVSTYGGSIILSTNQNFYYDAPNPATFIISHGYSVTSVSEHDRIVQLGGSGYLGAVRNVRLMRYGNGKVYIEIYYANNSANTVGVELTPIGRRLHGYITPIDFTAVTSTSGLTLADSCPVMPGGVSGVGYTGSGGQQNPDFFGRNKVGFLMSDQTVNGDGTYKNWMYMDCYHGTDAGGTTAIGVSRTNGRMFVMRSDSNRSSWNTLREVVVAETNGDVTMYGALSGLSSIELNSRGTLSNYGGFIDFHYNGSSSDYTSRIIEDASGRIYLNASAGVRIGNAVLIYDSTNNALKVQHYQGGAANFYALGGVSALGMSAGTSGMINANLLPETTNAYTLGDSSHRFSYLYANNVNTKNLSVGGQLSLSYATSSGGGTSTIYAGSSANGFIIKGDASTTLQAGSSLLLQAYASSTAKSTITLTTSAITANRQITVNSDMRLKDVYGAAEAELEDIARTPIFNFKWRDLGDADTFHLGTAADYIQGLFPSAVTRTEDGILALDYSATALAAAVITARTVMTHEEEIAALKRRIGELENEIETLKAA